MTYNQQHSFAKFKDISDFKEISLDSMHKRLNDFHKKFIKLKGVNPPMIMNMSLKKKKKKLIKSLIKKSHLKHQQKIV